MFINPCRIYIDEILCSIAMERERESERERENGNENERKRICRSTKLNDICFFLLLGGQNQLDGPEKLSRFFKLTKYSQEMSMRTGCACI